MSDVTTLTVADLRFNRVPDNKHNLGHRVRVPISRYVSSDDLARQFAGVTLDAMLCINKSGGTLTPGLAVLAGGDGTTYGPGVACGGAAGATDHALGYVSPFISESTVAANNAFWLVIGGLTQVQYDGSSDISVGERLELAASGRVAATDYLYPGDVVGWSWEAITSSSAAGPKFWALMKGTI